MHLGNIHVWDLSEYLLADDYNNFLNDCSTAMIDKTDGSDTTRREEH